MLSWLFARILYRLAIGMKAYRILYWILLVCSLGYGLYSGARFCWLLFTLQTLLLLTSFGMDLWTFFSFSYVQTLSAEQAEKGGSILLHIGIYNDKPFPFTHMRVHVEAPSREEDKVLEIALAPKENCAFDLEFSLPLRGEFKIGMTKLEVQDIFGLLPIRFDLRLLPYYRLKNLLVLPRVLEVSLPEEEDGALSSSRGAAVSGREEFSELVNWQPGDPLSRIHWKASAKTQTLVKRRYQDLAGKVCLIFLDCQTVSETSADRLCECAAALLSEHLGRGDTVELRSGSSSKTAPAPANSLAELTSLRQWLAVLPFHGEEGCGEQLKTSLQSKNYHSVYVLGGKEEIDVEAVLKETGVPALYWVAEPLDQKLPHGKAISLNGTELSEFLSRKAAVP